MESYTLEHDRNNCIGCTACESVAPKYWQMEKDGKVSLKGSKKRADGIEELKIQESALKENKEAAECCPVNVIHIKDSKGSKII